jgi:lipopolysaccharide transport system ATP-binding protein
MVDDVVIRAEGLGKKYMIGRMAEFEWHFTFRDMLVRGSHDLWRKATDMVRGRATLAGDTTEEFWALRDINIEVKRGEVFGIIGRNGAGKSTLLKILSRITEPSEGSVMITGRVASLLEVGTGFHPELTGRENVYLNGAILGMTRAEIRRRFDEIVAFAEIDQFLDTPVKRYSSGMYVRLAFAVAAHLEPEILIVDEVLAVGDVQFQKKCLGKLSEAAGGGRTVLFVSHDMGAIERLCDHTVILEHGQVAFRGQADEAVTLYLSEANSRVQVADSKNWIRTGSNDARILSVTLENDAGSPQTLFRMGEPLIIVVRVHFLVNVEDPIFGINITTDTGIMVADCRSSHYDLHVGKVAGLITYRMRIEAITLYPRTYVIAPWVADSSDSFELDWVRNAATFLVTSSPNFLSGASVNANHGIAFIPTSWNFSNLDVAISLEAHDSTDLDKELNAQTNRHT